MRADEASLTLALRNLIRNAVEHAPEQSRVFVNVTDRGASAAIQVLDTGPGIRPDELPQIRDRFVRGRRAKGPGSGLGLSIVELVAARFEAVLRLTNRPGSGLEASLELPSEAIRAKP